ncbi:acyltransferase [Pseudoalteromonas sp. SSMSWG5]|uniref:acyltransferase n=1 Tax=Pseudoalteromonas sp. SSMSWG5 TaxID=3139396 RepID=UPI003BA9C54B
MTGRDVFRLFGVVFTFLSFIIKILPRFFRVFLLNLFSSFPTNIGVLIRFLLFKSLANKCGDNLYIGRWVIFKNLDRITVGSNVSIHDYCYIDAKGGVEIGNDVAIAHNCSFISFEHSFNKVNIPIKYQPLKFKKIYIADNVWIGCGVRVLAGTIIGEKTVIAANSVTKGELEGERIYAGIPARVIKDI